MLFEISKNLGKSSVAHTLLTEKQTTKKIKIYKTLIKLRIAKINPHKKSTSRFYMEHQKMLNLLNDVNDSKFVTRKRNIVNDNSNSSYAAANEITYNTEILQSNLCDYKNAYILVSDDITAVQVILLLLLQSK